VVELTGTVEGTVMIFDCAAVRFPELSSDELFDLVV
jgi:hypothetical protein